MTATRFLRRCCMGAALVVAAALAGCATGPREITSSVQSYANMGGIHLPATYRMELLPFAQIITRGCGALMLTAAGMLVRIVG